MRSSVIEGILIEELERNQRIARRYQVELESLPKGTIIKRKINNEVYCYLNYRENKKVVSKYLGKESQIDLDYWDKQIQKRQNILSILKKLKIEEKELLKILTHPQTKKPR